MPGRHATTVTVLVFAAQEKYRGGREGRRVRLVRMRVRSVVMRPSGK
jgi:hypothetical protein